MLAFFLSYLKFICCLLLTNVILNHAKYGCRWGHLASGLVAEVHTTATTSHCCSGWSKLISVKNFLGVNSMVWKQSCKTNLPANWVFIKNRASICVSQESAFGKCEKCSRFWKSWKVLEMLDPKSSKEAAISLRLSSLRSRSLPHFASWDSRVSLHFWLESYLIALRPLRDLPQPSGFWGSSSETYPTSPSTRFSLFVFNFGWL